MMDHRSSGCSPAEKFPTFASGRLGRGVATLLKFPFSVSPSQAACCCWRKNHRHTGMDLRDELIRPISGSPNREPDNFNAFVSSPLHCKSWRGKLNGATLSVTHFNGADLGGAKLIQADPLAPVVRSVERLTEPPDRFN
jgi:hypothetical protein